ncbi:GAF domain-containing protein [Streptosporangium sp. KLBMP 9127]|nr:GAF domain-containing protein [Streptosporangium sp. KLBMP 9127]
MLIASFAGHDPGDLIDRLVEAAAALCAVRCSGLVEVEPADELAFPMRSRIPPGDPLQVSRWVQESGVLKILATNSDPVRLPRDAGMGDPGFLAAPIPLSTRRQAYLWVAGRRFDGHDEELLTRFAVAAGRALEAACGFEAATRMLRAVHAFSAAERAVP